MVEPVGAAPSIDSGTGVASVVTRRISSLPACPSPEAAALPCAIMLILLALARLPCATPCAADTVFTNPAMVAELSAEGLLEFPPSAAEFCPEAT